MSDKIISLCYVSKRNSKSTELCRIADYVDGDFDPYFHESNTDFYGSERDLIYGSSSTVQGEIGTIALYEWWAYLNANNEWRTVVTNVSNITWCEVFFTDCQNLKELVSVVKAGFHIYDYDRAHDLILCCKPSGNKCVGLRVERSEAVYKDQKLCLLEHVTTLAHVTFDTLYATGTCKCRYSPYDTRLYLAHNNACKVVGSVELKSKDEIIGKIIRQNITRDGLKRKERQAARTALEKLDMPSVIQTIAAQLKCSDDQAAKYAEEYIVRTRERMDSTTTLRLIDMLIENDSEAVQCLRAAVQKQWEETHQEQIKTAQQRQAEATAALEGVRKRIADAEASLQATQARQTVAESKAEEALLLQEQIEAEIQKRLEVFKTDYASVLVENAVIAATTMSPHQNSAINVSALKREDWTVVLPENGTHSGTLEENIDVAVEIWSEICANPDMARGLTLLSFAAYARNHPLLVVGEGAIPVSDIISSSICGQPSIKIHANDECQNYQNIIEEIEKRPEAVVCLINGLKSGYEHLRTLMQMCPHRMFVVTEMHTESLAIEPISLYSVFLPILCDYFYTGGRVEELPTYDCSNELHSKAGQMEARSIKQAKATVSQWLRDGFYPPVVLERCANLLALMNLFAGMLGINANTAMALAIEFLFFPLLKCMRKVDTLMARLEECTILDGDRKDMLISLISTED